jgi:CelD/BcsL family acetyltransferase involved in cellulose biosynthesis
MAGTLTSTHSPHRSADFNGKPVYQVHPLDEARWAEFVDQHPGSSVFHSVPWLEALQQTYGYEPVVYTTSPPGSSLEDGLVLCSVASWITGRRLVSLPFSDHCEPLVEDTADQQSFVSAIERTLKREKMRYVEIRGPCALSGTTCLYRSPYTYCLHRLDLRPEINTLFHNLHKSSTQRKILRAEREKLIYETGRSQALIDAFFNLLLMTRRRHRVPPQPKKWFRNLINCFGDAAQIRVAFKDRLAVAAILTLQHKDTLVYKYGCSDPRFNKLGGTHLLFWKSIQEAKTRDLRVFDLGRTEWSNTGLLIFKDRWGSTRSSLRYERFTLSAPSKTPALADVQRLTRLGERLIPYVPSWFLRIVGSLCYKHIA